MDLDPDLYPEYSFLVVKVNFFRAKVLKSFFQKIDNITLDPDPIWSKILDPDKIQSIWIPNTAFWGLT